MVFDYFQLFRWFFYMLIENYRKRYQNQLLLEWLKIIENDWKPSKIIFLTCCKLNSRYCAIGLTWVAKINLVFFLTQSQDGLLNRFFQISTKLWQKPPDKMHFCCCYCCSKCELQTGKLSHSRNAQLLECICCVTCHLKWISKLICLYTWLWIPYRSFSWFQLKRVKCDVRLEQTLSWVILMFK